ncbi:MAG: ABC transporter permease [Lautropia sp.]
MARRHRVALDRLLVLVALAAAWQATNWAAGDYWVASLPDTVVGFWQSLRSGELLVHAGYTLKASAWGILIGGVPGIAAPFALQRMPRLSALLEPYLVAGYGVPKVAIAPLLIVLFGIDIESKIAVVASAVFFIVLFSTRAGIQMQDARLVHMARIVGANRMQVGLLVTLPAAVPYILSGFRIAVPYAISSAVIAELISSNRGLGYLVQANAMDFNTRGVFVALLAITILAVAANWLVSALEAYLLRWRPAASLGEGAHAAEG